MIAKYRWVGKRIMSLHNVLLTRLELQGMDIQEYKNYSLGNVRPPGLSHPTRRLRFHNAFYSRHVARWWALVG